MGFNGAVSGGSMAAGRVARQERARKLRTLRASLAREKADLKAFQDCLQTTDSSRRGIYRQAIRETEAIIAGIEGSLKQLGD